MPRAQQVLAQPAQHVRWPDWPPGRKWGPPSIVLTLSGGLPDEQLSRQYCLLHVWEAGGDKARRLCRNKVGSEMNECVL